MISRRIILAIVCVLGIGCGFNNAYAFIVPDVTDVVEQAANYAAGDPCYLKNVTMSPTCNPSGTAMCDLRQTMCYCKALFKNPWSQPLPWQHWTDPNSTPANQEIYTFAAPVVQCFTNMDPTPDSLRQSQSNGYFVPQLGIIPAVTVNFLRATQTYYVPIVQAILTVIVVLFGIKLTLGNVKNVKKDTWTMFFKIGGVFLFMVWAPKLYQWVIFSMQGLSYLMSQASSSLNNTGFCIGVGPGVMTGGADTGTNKLSDLWAVWDCIFGYLLIAAGTLGFGTLIMLMAKTQSIGLIIAFIGLYVIISLFFALARSIHYYLMGVLGFSFVFSLGYLFVPMLLFQSSVTYQFFQKWLFICLGYALAPLILIGFMGTMLVALDIATLSGQYSIVRQVAPGTFGQSITANGQSGINNRANNPLFLISQPGMGWSQPGFKSMFNIVLNNSLNDTGVACGATAPPTNGVAPPTYASQGIGSNLVDLKTLGSCYDRLQHPGATPVGLPVDNVNLNQILGFASQTAPASNFVPAPVTGDQTTPFDNWKRNEFLAFATAALISYVMYALLAYIPDLASDLVSQGMGSVRMLATSKFVGEQQIAQGMEAAKSSALSGADSAMAGTR